MTQIVIIESDPMTRGELEQVLSAQGLSNFCTVTPNGDFNEEGPLTCFWIKNPGETPPKNIHINESHQFTKPLRIGVLLDRVRRQIALGKQQAAQDELVIGPYALNVLNNGLSHRETGTVVKLTDKESRILAFLNDQNGELVDRETLLGEVWGYAENVETHTLETHIYRLRQKIENDPANPEILLTENQGYRLSV